LPEKNKPGFLNKLGQVLQGRSVQEDYSLGNVDFVTGTYSIWKWDPKTNRYESEYLRGNSLKPINDNLPEGLSYTTYNERGETGHFNDGSTKFTPYKKRR